MSILLSSGSPYWRISFVFRGKRYIKSSRTTDKRIAERMEIEWKAKLHAQKYLGEIERIRLSDAMVKFCESQRHLRSHGAVMAHYRTHGTLLPTFNFLDELKTSDLERFKSERMQQGVSQQTIKHGLNFVRGVIKLARKLGYAVPTLEFPAVVIPKHPLRYLSQDEERRLLYHLRPDREGSGLRPVDERDAEMKRTLEDAHDLVILLLDTGARYGEIANISWSRIDMSDRTIKLWRSKVQNETILFMSDRVYEVLLRRFRQKSTEYVFRNRAGGPRGYSTQSIRKAFRKAGLKDCRIHTLRHTHASRLVQNGMSLYEVREILGHTDIKTTMRYAHLESRQVTSKARDVINRLNAARSEDQALPTNPPPSSAPQG